MCPRYERTPGALPVKDLLPQDVCVPAVLGEFAQYVEVHPAQRGRLEQLRARQAPWEPEMGANVFSRPQT
jgi:hypothetical protein